MSILRAIAITRPQDFPGGGIFLFILMSTVEPAVMLICACLPVMRPLVGKILRTVPGYSSWRSRSHTYINSDRSRRSTYRHKDSSRSDEDVKLKARSLPVQGSRHNHYAFPRFGKHSPIEPESQARDPWDRQSLSFAMEKVETVIEAKRNLPPAPPLAYNNATTFPRANDDGQFKMPPAPIAKDSNANMKTHERKESGQLDAPSLTGTDRSRPIHVAQMIDAEKNQVTAPALARSGWE